MEEEEESQIHFSENNKGNNKDVEMDDEQEIQVEFLFSEMRDNYFHNIKTFINPLLDFEAYNTSEMSDVIINQLEVGSVIKVGLEDDNDKNQITAYNKLNNQNVEVYAVFTILNLNFYNDKSFVSKIKEFILNKAKSHCNNEEQLKKVIELLDNPKLGLIINERAINLPMELIPPLINLCVSDIDKYNVENPSDNKYHLDVLLNITKYVLCQSQGKSHKRAKIEKTVEDTVFYKFEDEEIINKSLVNFSYKIPYAQKDLEILENKNEPQYKNISFIGFKDFLSLNKLLNFNANN